MDRCVRTLHLYTHTQGLASPDSNMSNTSSVGDEVVDTQERVRSTNRPRKRVHSDAESSRKSGTMLLVGLCAL